MEFVPGNGQHIGARDEQQDAFGFSRFDDPEFVAHAGVLAVVADGMGGMAHGREASHRAVELFLAAYDSKRPEESIRVALDRCVGTANQGVFELAQATGQEGQVGTTLVAAVLSDAGLEWVSVGDSRLYLHRQGELRQLTRDHDFGAHLDAIFAQGSIGEATRSEHPDRGALVSFLGLAELVEVGRSEEPLPLDPGDHVLLCSDGLYRSLDESEIAPLLDADPEAAAEILVERAIAKGDRHQDNTTALVLGCAGAPPRPALVSRWARVAVPAAIVVALLVALLFVWEPVVREPQPQPVEAPSPPEESVVAVPPLPETGADADADAVRAPAAPDPEAEVAGPETGASGG